MNRRLTLLTLLTLPMSYVFGAGVPPPDPQGAPPPGPGLPIDGGLYVLLIISLLFGIYKVYKHHNIKKASN